MNKINPILNKLFYFYRNRLIDKTEINEYSGGYYSAMIRKKGCELFSNASGIHLDIGCGEGLVIENLQKNGINAHIIGIDSWNIILKRFREREEIDHKTVSLVQGDCLVLPLPDNSVDSITCLNLLLNLENYKMVKKTIIELVRVLKPDGKLAFDIRNRENFIHLARYKYAKVYDDTLKTPLNTYFPSKIEQLVDELGLKIDKKIPIGFPEFRKFSPIYLYHLIKYPPKGNNSKKLIPPVSLPVKISDGIKLMVTPKLELSHVEKSLNRVFKTQTKLVGTGQVALYLILKAYSRIIPNKKEVIMPSYTAPSVYVTIKSCGFIPKIVDIEFKSMKYNMEMLETSINDNTLSILNIHPFGIPLNPEYLKKSEKIREKKIPVIEDNAQGLGSKIYERYSGTISEAGFSSLNRGKNMPTEGGGIIFTNNMRLYEIINDLSKNLELSSIKKKDLLPLFTILYSLAIRPAIYGPLQSIIGKFKQTAPPNGTDLIEYTKEQATLLTILLPNLNQWNREKLKRANIYFTQFKNIQSFTTLKIERGSTPAFNRFPLLCSSKKLRDKIIEELKHYGVEASSLYIKSIPEHFSDSENVEKYSIGNDFAKKLVTLPLQPDLSLNSIRKICDIVKIVEKREKNG